MSVSFLSTIMSTYLLVSMSAAQADCSAALRVQIAGAERIVDSLRPDKAGQMRVFASDGSEFPAGQAQWMKGQLKSVARACSKGDEAAAATQLQSVLALLNSHHRAT